MSEQKLYQRVLNEEFFSTGSGAGATIRAWTGVERQLAREIETIKLYQSESAPAALRKQRDELVAVLVRIADTSGETAIWNMAMDAVKKEQS